MSPLNKPADIRINCIKVHTSAALRTQVENSFQWRRLVVSYVDYLLLQGAREAG